MNVDIEKFFDNVTPDIIRQTFRITNNKDNTSSKIEKYTDTIINALCNDDTGGISLGNPMSSVLANFATKHFINYLQNILNYHSTDPTTRDGFKSWDEEKQNKLSKMYNLNKDRKYNVTIYADDIIISSNKKINQKFVEDTIDRAFEKFNLGFKVNKTKTRLTSNQRREGLGYAVNHNNQIIKPRNYLKANNIRVILEKLASKKLPISMLENNFSLQGKINECIRPEFLLNEEGPITRYIRKFKEPRFINLEKVLLTKGNIRLPSKI